MNNKTARTLLTNKGQVLAVIAADQRARLRDIAAELELTERCVFGIVDELVVDGLLLKHKVGRRNEYTVAPTTVVECITSVFTTDNAPDFHMTGANA